MKDGYLNRALRYLQYISYKNTYFPEGLEVKFLFTGMLQRQQILHDSGLAETSDLPLKFCR